MGLLSILDGNTGSAQPDPTASDVPSLKECVIDGKTICYPAGDSAADYCVTIWFKNHLDTKAREPFFFAAQKESDRAIDLEDDKGNQWVMTYVYSNKYIISRPQ